MVKKGEPHLRKPHKDADHMVATVGVKEERKVRAHKERNHDIWFGLGMFGLVGWAVAIPALAGIALGIWIDNRWPSPYSWTLMLLVIGVLTGCLNAWYWVKRESGAGSR